MRGLLRLAGCAALVAASLLTGVRTAGAQALPISQCSTTSGVVLAVDFGHWGGPVVRACGSTPTTGFTLLNQGGWQSTGTHHDGPGFICRISYSGYQGGAAYPSTAEQACVNTPPSTGYWSYWHADVGASSWTYSQQGARNYSPRPGSVDLWTFGGANSSSQPSISPDSVRAHNSPTTGGGSAPAPAPHSSAPVAGQSTGPATSSGTSAAGAGTPGRSTAAGSSGPPSAGTRPGSTSAHPSSTSSTSGTRTSSPAGSATATASTGAATIVNAEPAAPAKHGAGSALPGAVTALLVLALGSGAGVTAWRRRQAG